MLSYVAEILDSLLPKSVKRSMKSVFPGIDRFVYRLLWRLAPDAPRELTIRRGTLKGRRFACSLKRERDYWLGIWEPAIEAFLISEISPGDVIYDIGAHKGYFSLIAAYLTGVHGRVISFEPNPINRKSALDNLLRNPDLAPRIAILPYAVSDKTGAELFTGSADSTIGRLVHNSDADLTYQVSCITLDDFVEQEGCPPAIIKMDIEGGEQWALQGMAKTFVRVRPTLLIEVHTPEAFHALEVQCSQHNYALAPLSGAPGLSDYAWDTPRHIVARPMLTQ